MGIVSLLLYITDIVAHFFCFVKKKRLFQTAYAKKRAPFHNVENLLQILQNSAQIACISVKQTVILLHFSRISCRIERVTGVSRK